MFLIDLQSFKLNFKISKFFTLKFGLFLSLQP